MIKNTNVKDCIKFILQKDPNKRPSLEQLSKHAWVTKNGTQQVDISTDDFDEVGNMITRKMTNHGLDFESITTPRATFGNINRLLNVEADLHKSLEIPRDESDDELDFLDDPGSKPSKLTRENKVVDEMNINDFSGRL